MAVTTGGKRGSTTRTTKPRVQQDAQGEKRPSDDEIRILAYRLYERRCVEGAAGDPETDWIEAERLLLSGD